MRPRRLSTHRYTPKRLGGHPCPRESAAARRWRPTEETDATATMEEGEAGSSSAAAPAPAADAAEPPYRADPDSGVPLFECCVCLDLLYKPVVLVCGHISCFWCVHRAMNGLMESHCPMCRQPYKHFPAICQVLHNLLWKIEHTAYKRREKEVLEIESKQNCFSPQFVDHFNKDAVYVCSSPMERSTSSAIDTSLENGSVDEGNSNMEFANVDGADIDKHVTFKYGDLKEGGRENRASQKLCVSDALCAGCKQLLFQPAVLNCGHVYCKPCLLSLGNETPRCQVCQGVHPGVLPKVCLQLNNFLEKQFPKEYAVQREAFQGSSSSGCQANKLATSFDKHDVKFGQTRSEELLKVNVDIGCDSCGMYPIVGKRYKCVDCPEKIGFDLCEPCYDTRSKLPSRFNQQHTPDHNFVLDESRLYGHLHSRGLIYDGDFYGNLPEPEIPDNEA